MKIELWHIIFTILAGFLLFWFFAKGAYITREENVTVMYTQYLTNACDDAVSTVDKYKDIVFDTNVKREKAIKQFYYTLGRSFDYTDTNKEPLLYNMVPCVVLIDNNGFYVNYTDKYKGSDGMTYYNQVYSGINTWMKRYDSYYVQYYLDDTVTISKEGSDKIFSGYYEDVYKEVEDSGLSIASLSFMISQNSFIEEKDSAIINMVNSQVEYYINNHNEAHTNNAIKYSFTMTKSLEDTLQGKLLGPTVLSFIQGAQTSIGEETINVFALSASEVREVLKYYVSKDEHDNLYYHEKGCPYIETNSKVYSSMEEAAKHGADPCPKCMR